MPSPTATSLSLLLETLLLKEAFWVKMNKKICGVGRETVEGKNLEHLGKKKSSQFTEANPESLSIENLIIIFLFPQLKKKSPMLTCSFVLRCMVSCFSCVQLFVTLWTLAHQAPLSMGFSRQER